MIEGRRPRPGRRVMEPEVEKASEAMRGLLLAAAVLAACGEPPASEGERAAEPEVAPEEPVAVATERAGPGLSDPVEVVERLHLGLDVSGHSGEIDWRAVVEEGHTFAIHKATEGVDLRDPDFHLNWPRMKDAGLVRGAYHFYVTEDDPAEQARFYIDNVVLEPGDLAPVVDVELMGHGTGPGLPQRLRAFLDLLEEHYGVKPIVYTAWKFWNAHVGEGFGDHPLWVAEYEVEQPVLPAGWSDWHLWQWKGDADVAGVEKGADLNRVNRAGVDLAALIVPHPDDPSGGE